MQELLKMRAQLIFENREFRRGLSSKAALNVGKSRLFLDKEQIEIIEPYYTYWPDGYDELEQASKGSDAEYLSATELDEYGLDSDSEGVYHSGDLGKIMQYDKEDNTFFNVERFTGNAPITDFLYKHPEVFKRL